MRSRHSGQRLTTEAGWPLTILLGSSISKSYVFPRPAHGRLMSEIREMAAAEWRKKRERLAAREGRDVS